MIENRLTFFELKRMLKPVLRLEGLPKIISEFRNVFPANLQSLSHVQEYTQKYNVTYEGFKVFIKGLHEISPNSICITIDFRISKKWYHYFKHPTSRIVKHLKNICLNDMNGLFFSKCSVFGYDNDSPYNPQTQGRKEASYNYDGRSFNSKWSNGYEVSALLIAPSDNQKYYFVEFHYNSNCYPRLNNEIFLKDNWKEYISDINKYYKEEVELFFKQKN